MRCVHCFFETFDDTHECVALRCIKNSSLVRAATSCTDEFSWACHTRTELSSVQLTATLILVPLNRLEKFTRACCLFTLLFCFYDKKGAGNDGGIEKKNIPRSQVCNTLSGLHEPVKILSPHTSTESPAM